MNEISIDLKENEENHLNELALIYKVKCCILNNKDSFIYQGEEIVIGSDENRKYINYKGKDYYFVVKDKEIVSWEP